MSSDYSNGEKQRHKSSRDLIYKDNELLQQSPSNNSGVDELNESRRSKYSKAASTTSRKSRRSLSDSRRRRRSSSSHTEEKNRQSRSNKNKSSRHLGSSSGSANANASHHSPRPSSSSSSRHLHTSPVPNTPSSSSRSLGPKKGNSSNRHHVSRSRSDRGGMGDVLGSPSSVTSSRATHSTFPISSVDLSHSHRSSNGGAAAAAADGGENVESTSVSNSSHLDADVMYSQGGKTSSRDRRSGSKRRQHHHHDTMMDAPDVAHKNDNNHNRSGHHSPRRSGSSRSSSKRHLSKERSKRHMITDIAASGGSDQHTTASSTAVDLLYDGDDFYKKSSKKSHKRASKPGVEQVKDSSKYKSDKSDGIESLMTSSHSKSSKRTNGTKSSKHVLYGVEDGEDGYYHYDQDAKTKASKSSSSPKKRSNKPGVERWYDNDHVDPPAHYHKNMLYGVEEEQRKKGSKKKKAYRPGIERVTGTRDLLYGDEEAKKHANYSSSSRAVAANDDGYAYDFPIATGSRGAYNSQDDSNSLMVDSHLPGDEPSTSAVSVSEEASQTTRRQKSVSAGSVKLVEENKPGKKKTSTSCVICGILFALLVVVLAVVGGFVWLTGDDDDAPQDIASIVNGTMAPTNLVVPLPPTESPSTNFPSSSPTVSTKYDPPSEEDCLDIANNRTLPGQENLDRKDFNIKFDVTLSLNGDITGEAVRELLDALERLFVPRMVGCSEVDIGRNRDRRRLGYDVQQEQKQQRMLQSRYVIGNADVTVIENTDFQGQEVEDAECSAQNTAEPERCHVVEVEMAVYLKGAATDFEIISVISNLGEGNLVPPLELSNTFSEVHMSSVDSTVPTEAPSPAPSALASLAPSTWPSASPSSSPTDSPVVGPSPPPTPPPTGLPSNAPSSSPTVQDTAAPSVLPTSLPSISPSGAPTLSPIVGPTPPPTKAPTAEPSITPSSFPSKIPTLSPTSAPTYTPTLEPTSAPTYTPTSEPTSAPTYTPTSTPTKSPSLSPTTSPTTSPTASPTLAPTPPCFCTSADACDNTADNFQIGCGSCAQTGACTSLAQSSAGSPPFTVGQDSCVGVEACKGAVIHTIENNSCTGTGSCRRQINVGSNSCTGEQSCDKQSAPNTLWDGTAANLLTVGSDSCQGIKACFSFEGTVGKRSCTGANSCQERALLTIGDNSCQGTESCALDPYVAPPCFTPPFCGFPSPPKRMIVADNSCQCDFCCRCMQNVKTSGSCNSLGECCDSTNPKVYDAAFVPVAGTMD
ncbi:unnamed protein product [Cylindrotheca closterium]|uniref:DUF7640 domain-containing protein n=1 Tax=Cylindrotheca closterium TaxID=2856 RepID=A0AAD2JPS0_9STRA|nr:unnamed protein product [Cylindrotheca closterium]